MIEMMSKGIPTIKNTITSDELERSYQYCREIVKQSGSNFYYGMWLTLNKKKRNALFAIYAWMRTIDDIADSPLPNEEKIAQLNDFYQTTNVILETNPSIHHQHMNAQGDVQAMTTQELFWPAFRQTIMEYALSPDYFKHMFLGQLQSVQQNQYDTFDALYEYCYRVAASVGQICICIWGYKGGKSTLKMAEYRGVALQLTNIIRDFEKDRANGVLFIPEEWMQNAQTSSHSQIHTLNTIEANQMLQQLITHAEYYYNESRDLERNISRIGSLSLRVMTKSYRLLLTKLRKNPQALGKNKDISLNQFEKISVCFVSFFQWCLRLNG